MISTVQPSATALLPAAPDARFDSIAALARRMLDVPSVQVTIVTPEEQRVPGRSDADAANSDERSMPLSYSICQHVIVDEAPLVLADTRTENRLAGNLSVQERGVLAYAGMPLVASDGQTVGALCFVDDHPREWTPDEVGLMREFAAICSSELQLRQAAARSAVAADRDRIARDLASDVFGELLQLSMVLAGLQSASTGDAADVAHRAMDTVDLVLKTIRRTIFDVRPDEG